ncbi:MAG: bifunctional D-glycero-beta-D-manno-heptose-7-phosphate kinase/D-glycero-beta-D-manno-heptose 1-phosphate adenylyltransferase HldE [Desulfobacteraceae bacterium]|nr:bifunctional D-glycero-beta-D-manno-heptose-7-phosphate kinase/D-glycero-beta-D-manno-heptose 1-phosphate adenylyltransferase HldE [Desulfobacteraceae bacterium]
MITFPDFNRVKVVVVGDVLLDRYVWGHVERISPEAPVPVVRIERKTGTLGGAGNVALNLSGLNCRSELIGIRGDDSPGEFLMEILAQERIDNNLIIIPHRPTPTKTRIIGQGQQIVRLDEEVTEPFSSSVYESLLRMVDKAIIDAHAVILSDYGKGVLRGDVTENIISRCRRRRIPVFVDPKGNTWERYTSAHCITPNEAELSLVAPFSRGDTDALAARAVQVMQTYNLKHLIVTRGSRGMSVFGRDDEPIHIPTLAREVFDVSGAGDTVIATVAAAVGAGMKLPDAAALANTAAGVVIGKIGTTPIKKTDLEKGITGAASGRRTTKKPELTHRDQAKPIVDTWRNNGNRIVFTNGCFDLLHTGHINLLKAAASYGDKLIVGLNSDDSIRRIKGRQRPLNSETDRSCVLSGIETVDMVVLFDEDTPYQIIELLQPDILVKGGDWAPEDIVGGDIVEARGGKVIVFPTLENRSTTGMIDKIKNMPE